MTLVALCAACSKSRAPAQDPLAYCPGQTAPTSGTECRDDRDCGETERCEPPISDEATVRAWTLPVVAPPVCVAPTACTTDDQCSDGSVCDDPRPELMGTDPRMQVCPTGAMICIAACTCAQDERCRDDGHCEITPCDADGALSCPVGSACMPGVGDPGVELTREAQAGCVRVPCDQPGGVVCAEHWTCDPANAPAGFEEPPWGNTAGCAPIPCDEGFTCEGELVCYPDGASSAVRANFNTFATRADGRWVDPHGCVQPTCEEGWECTSIGPTECVVGDPRAGNFGCRNLMCDEPGGADCEELSSGAHHCNPDTANLGIPLGSWGCAIKDCHAGYTCSAGETCNAGGRCVSEACAADPNACLPSADAGTTAGTTAGSGAGSGGTSGAQGSERGDRGDMPLDSACIRDRECACGSCVLGRCAPRPGTCTPR